MTKEIELTQGQVALVDDEDYEWLNQWKWHAMANGGTFYAKRDAALKERAAGKKKNVFMHREIMQPPPGMQVDHVNHDGLDNRRANLRNVTQSQNQQNRRGPTSNNILGVKNVAWNRRIQAFQVSVQANGKLHHVGYFGTLEDAVVARDQALAKYHGEFASQGVKE